MCVICPRTKGGYRALDMGLPHEAMVDMTGGVAEVVIIDALRDLPSFIRLLLAKGALINCANCRVRRFRVVFFPCEKVVYFSVLEICSNFINITSILLLFVLNLKYI